MWRSTLIIAAFSYGAYHWWLDRPLDTPPGVLAPDDPVQGELEKPTQFFKNGVQLKARASFEISARVLAKKRYHFDPLATVSPIDLALGWGRMSDLTVLDQIDIHQGQRFYFWSTERFPIPRKEIQEHSANMHMIPADSSVEHRLNAARHGQVIALRGYLVDVAWPRGAPARTSLRRDDTGPGACEIVWVEKVALKSIYR